MSPIAAIYEMTIFFCIALLAIVVTVYVLATSLLGRATEQARRREEDTKEEAKRRLANSKNEFESKLHETTSADEFNAVQAEMRRSLKGLTRFVEQAKRDVAKYELLTARGLVLWTGLTFIFALALAGAARFLVKESHTEWSSYLLWGLSLLLLFSGLYRVYRALMVIEGLAMSSEEVQNNRMVETLQAVLRESEEAKRPILGLEFVGRQLPFRIERDTQEIIECNVYLTQGEAARGVELLFTAPTTFGFPGAQAAHDGDNLAEAHTASLQYPFALTKGKVWRAKLLTRTPPAVGSFEMEYRVVCEGFNSGKQKVRIEVV